MRFPLPQLVTILLLIHMGFGCCFHHAHTCDSTSCKLETTEACHSGVHQHPHPELAACADDVLCPVRHDTHSHNCSGNECTFVAGRTRVVAAVEEANQLFWLVTTSPFHPIAGHFAFGRQDEREQLLPPLRHTHLQLHILQV